VWAQRSGLAVALLSARASGATTQRAAQLAIRTVVQGVGSKLQAYEQILRDARLPDEQVAFMGDDLLDLPVLARVGLAARPADAAPEVLEQAHWVSHRRGPRRRPRVHRDGPARPGPLGRRSSGEYRQER
jgi:3-deoxy-D-manno-octulosonate 8-phosphate phosphatase (KDO 8-P phosphatase)